MTWIPFAALSAEEARNWRALCDHVSDAEIGNYEFCRCETKLWWRRRPGAMPADFQTSRLTKRLAMTPDSNTVLIDEDRVHRLPIARIKPCPLNPRKRFNETKLLELAANIKALGVVHPLLVRPVADGYEAIAGHRRLRAAALAELDVLPAMVRVISDREALDLMLSENLQREDLNPIEEAEGLQQLLELKGDDGEPLYTRESLAAKLGRTKMHISNALRLLRLPKRAREACETGELAASVAYILASVPSAEQRAAAAKEVLDGYGDGPLSKRETSDLIRRKYMTELRGAPFELTDKKLLPETSKDGERYGGACVDCPWNSKNIEWQHNKSQTQMCTHVECFREKIALHTQAAKDKALAAGHLIVEGQRANRYIWFDGTPQQGFVKLNEKPSASELSGTVDAKKVKSWKKMLDGDTTAPVVVVIDDKGRAHEIVETRHAVEAAKQNGYEQFFAGKKMAAPAQQRSADAEERERRKLELATAMEGLAQMVEAAEKGKCVENEPTLHASLPVLVLFELALHHAGCDGETVVIKRRGLTVKKTSYDQPDREGALREAATAMNPGQVFALSLELLAAGGMKYHGVRFDGFTALARAYGLDVKEIEAKVKSAAKAKKKKGNAVAESEPEQEEVSGDDSSAADESEAEAESDEANTPPGDEETETPGGILDMLWDDARETPEEFQWQEDGECLDPINIRIEEIEGAYVFIALSGNGWHSGASLDCGSGVIFRTACANSSDAVIAEIQFSREWALRRGMEMLRGIIAKHVNEQAATEMFQFIDVYLEEIDAVIDEETPLVLNFRSKGGAIEAQPADEQDDLDPDGTEAIELRKRKTEELLKLMNKKSWKETSHLVCPVCCVRRSTPEGFVSCRCHGDVPERFGAFGEVDTGSPADESGLKKKRKKK